MKSNRPLPEPTPAPADAPEPRRGLLHSWNSFWFTPADPIGLHWVRVLAGLLFLGWLLSFWGQQEAFFGMRGWFDRQAYLDASRLAEETPTPIGWSVLYLAGTNTTLLNLLYWGSIAVVVLFTAGVWTRITAILTWVVVVSFQANPAIGFDADTLLNILAFYLMIGYVLLGQWSRSQSLFGRLLGNRDTLIVAPLLFPADPGQGEREEKSHAANLALRLLQVHFAVVVVTSAFHKLQFGEYWGGVAFWFPLNPPLEVTQESLRRQAPDFQTRFFFLSLAQYIALAWQIGFPLFAWKRRGRLLLLGGAVLGWLGSVFLYRLPLFGPLYLIGCLSYLTAGEWRWVTSACSGLLNVVRSPRQAPAEKPGKARPQRLRTH